MLRQEVNGFMKYYKSNQIKYQVSDELSIENESKCIIKLLVFQHASLRVTSWYLNKIILHKYFK